MKKILVAMENEDLVEKLKKTGKYIVHEKVISFQDGVLQFLAKTPVDIIITKDDLSGDMTKEIYMKQIRLIAPNIKIVLFTQKLSEEYKGFLFANDIFNIVETDEIKFDEILDMIENIKGQVIYKNKEKQENNLKSPPVKVITKKLIAVFGTSGAGKTYFSSLLSNVISKKIKLNTLLIDMDLMNSATDIYNNINVYENSLSRVMEDIDNDSFDSNSLYESTTKAKKNSHLSYLINNASIYDAQNRLSTEYYSEIYSQATTKYDVTVVDLPATPFLDVVPFTLNRASEIFFVVNPNFVSIRQAIKHLELMVEVWGVPRDIIHVVVNKKRNSALEKSQIEMLLKGYKVCMEITDSDIVEEVVNGVKEIELSNVFGMDKILTLFGTDEEHESSKKENVYDRLNKILGVKK